MRQASDTRGDRAAATLSQRDTRVELEKRDLDLYRQQRDDGG